MKHISKAALGLLVISSVNQGAAFADDKLTEELLRRVEALEKRASLADRLESENKQLRARLEKTVALGEKNKAKQSTALATPPTASFSQYSDNSASEVAQASYSYQKPQKEKVWQGIYAGFNAGYGQNHVGLTGYDTYLSNSSELVTNYNSSLLYSGPVIGGQIGYNHQFSNNIVLGGELDLDYADIRNSDIAKLVGAPPPPGLGGLFGPTFNSTTYNPGLSQLYGNTNYTRIGMDWIGTVRARLGYSLGGFLPFITGGFAFGGLSGIINNATASATNGQNRQIDFEHGSNSTVQPGWVLGAGAEYMVANNWSIKGEYLYTQITGINIQTTGLVAFNSEAYGGFGTNLSTNAFGIHQARIGLNYHTNWLAAPAPVVAKY
jgi:outer membrane immunogenic protein